MSREIRTPQRSQLLSIFSRKPLRFVFGPVETLRRKILTRKYSEILASNDEVDAIYDDEQVRLAIVMGGLSISRATSSNTLLISELLGRHNIPYFAVPNGKRSQQSIGIASPHWTDFIYALQQLGDTRVIYVRIKTRDKSGSFSQSTIPLDSISDLRSLVTHSAISIFRYFYDPSTGQKFGLSAAIKVEKWDKHSNGDLIAHNTNERATRVSASLQTPSLTKLHGESYPTFSHFSSTSPFEFTEPIDAVYLWVDGTDQDWLSRRNKIFSQLTGNVPSASVDPSRFRDNGELRYSMRSVFHHCKWIRNIILVTDSQVPDWLDTSHPRIRLVDHQELFGSAGQLPTYNSHAISSRLHHIQGLSEQFLIFNDDVFIGRDVDQSEFFLSNGMSRFFLSRKSLPQLDFYSLPHEAARKRTVDLIEDNFGVKPTQIFSHAPVPQLRSLLMELEAEFPAAFAETQSHQIRSPLDFQINSWLHHYVGYLRQRSVPGNIKYAYFDLDDRSLIGKLNRLITTRWASTFCLNDAPDASPENLKFIKHWLARYFPEPAPWESTSESS